MLSDEVVVHEVQRNRMSKVVDLFTECVSQSGEPSHAHTHGQVLPFHHRCGDIFSLRLAVDPFTFTPDRCTWPDYTGPLPVFLARTF